MIQISRTAVIWLLVGFACAASGAALLEPAVSTVEERINNGIPSAHQPHNVFVMAFRDGGPTGQSAIFGGGSIISTRHVLTAAHLLVGYGSYQISYGSASLMTLRVAYPTQVSIYPNYVASTRQHDIAILGLTRGQTWSPAVNARPIRFSMSTFEPQVGRIGTVVGFGITFANEGFPSMTLQSAQLAVSAACGGTPITGAHFCGQPHGRPSNVCAGDGGAGYFVTDAGGPLLVGVTSVIPSGCTGQAGAGLTRVSLYSSWIQQNIA